MNFLPAVFLVIMNYNVYVLPDTVRTPGAINPDITQENIKENICSHGKWHTSSIRPPMEYTQSLKYKQLREYNFPDKDMRNFEEDHLIPLELGGHPTDPKNLWPQRRKGHPNAYDKDALENLLHAEVCSGRLTLKEAQHAIASNWVKAYFQYFIRPYLS